MNNKGFLLLDALLVVVITANMCLLCFTIYQAISRDEETVENYQNMENEYYYDLFGSYPECEVCLVDESD